MRILIVGLGLMGGAYAYRLREKGHHVYGVDLNKDAVIYAKDNGFIEEGDISPDKFIKDSDVIVLALYPTLILDFLKKYNSLFNDNQVITDICGVKTSFVNEAEKVALPAKYCSHHPMAGKEKIGIRYSKECEFNGANFLVTKTDNTDKGAIDIIKKLGVDLGFSNITEISTLKHDKVVGFTSQLTHAIAVSLVNSDRDKDTKNYIGDSYRDLTRIAKINDSLWSELFMENKDNLLAHIIEFESELDRIKKALNDEDKEALKEIFRSSTKIRSEMDKWEN